jgi:hypothetical protein
MAQPARIPDREIECCCANTMIAEGDRKTRLRCMGLGSLTSIAEEVY